MVSGPSPGKLWPSLRRFSANELTSAKQACRIVGRHERRGAQQYDAGTS
jgi:hypothetical protein